MEVKGGKKTFSFIKFQNRTDQLFIIMSVNQNSLYSQFQSTINRLLRGTEGSKINI